MKKILFVITEIAPLDRGGIGTFSKNMIKMFSGKFQMAFLYCGNTGPNAVEKAYPDLKFYYPPLSGQELKAKAAMDISEILSETIDSIFQKDIYDYVEFVDWGGWAHQTIMLKRSGMSNIPWSTTIAVRVHSTEHALRKYEHRMLSLRDGETSDFEMASLMLADLVICHVAPLAKLIADEIKNLFGRDIVDKIFVTSMPVYIVGQESKESIVANRKTNIVFSSKTQQIKRPDLFVQGTAAFLKNQENYDGDIVFAAHINEDAYTRSVLSLIPRELKNRFVHDRNLTPKDRDDAIAKGITVFTAEYESFCFAAYEASLSGSLVVLNSVNPAFADGTVWVDGANCIKFDGTSKDLSAALQKAFARKIPLQSVRDKLPEPQIYIPAEKPAHKKRPSVDILILVNNWQRMGGTINSIRLNAFDPETSLHLFQTQDALQDANLQETTCKQLAGQLNILHQGANCIEALAQCAQESNADYILSISSGDELSPDIFYAFQRACAYEDIDVYSSWTRNPGGEGYINRFYGAMTLNAWRYNLIAPPLAFYKTQLLRDYFKKAKGRIFNYYAMHLHFSMTGANYVISPRNECINSNPYNEYSIHDSNHVEKSAFFRAILLEFVQMHPPTLAILMAKPELNQPVMTTNRALPSFDTYIYRKYIKKIKFIDNILRFFGIVR